MSEEIDFRRAIQKCYVRLTEDLDPNQLLDYFITDEFLPYAKIRDIRERPSTSEKNQSIIGIVLDGSLKNYRRFKRLLRKSYQGHLADSLERMEKKLRDDRKKSPDPPLRNNVVPGPATNPAYVSGRRTSARTQSGACTVRPEQEYVTKTSDEYPSSPLNSGSDEYHSTSTLLDMGSDEVVEDE